MTRDEIIKHMVDRFLGWKLPENFSPDAGISFKRTFNEHTEHPMKHEPTGTNLFDAKEATEMVKYMLGGVNVPEKRVMYINMYDGWAAAGESTRKLADESANKKHLACIRVEWQEGQFDE